jgi:hypothetical protein
MLRITHDPIYKGGMLAGNRKAGSTCNHLGIQGAPQKRIGASCVPYSWEGSIAYTVGLGEGIKALISQKKWDKVKMLWSSLMAKLEEYLWVDQNELDRNLGFLINLLWSYPPLTPFLKGLHLRIDV